MNDIELMLKYIEEQNLTAANKIFAKVRNRGSDEDQYALAQELFSYGFLQEAKELYEGLNRKYPDESELNLLLAELLIDMDLEEEAYSYLEAIKHDDPNYPAALLLEADLYQLQGLHEVSEQKLLTAKDLLPDELVIDYALGELYMSQGRFLEAARCFKLVLTEGDKFAGNDINGRMAEALSAGGAFEESLAFYEKSLKGHVEINVLFGYGLTSYQAGNYRKSIKAFTQLREIDPDYHSLYLYLAKSHEHEEELDEALAVVQAGIALDEFQKEMFEYAGKLSLKTGKEAQAEIFFRQALVLDPEYAEAAMVLNRMLLNQERYEDVLEIVSAFDQVGGADPQFNWDAAVSFQHTEQYSQALNEYERAYNGLKNNREFLNDYGLFLMEDGKRAEAVTIFNKLNELEPANEEWIALLERLEEN